MPDNLTLPSRVAAIVATRNVNLNTNLDFHKGSDVKLRSGAGVDMARVAQFILGQKDIRNCVPFLINRDNVI